jgi:hypothetical protein
MASLASKTASSVIYSLENPHSLINFLPLLEHSPSTINKPDKANKPTSSSATLSRESDCEVMIFISFSLHMDVVSKEATHHHCHRQGNL